MHDILVMVKAKLSIKLWRWFGIDVLGPKAAQ